MAKPIPVDKLHDFKHCPMCQPYRRRRPFDILPWLAGPVVLLILAAIIVETAWKGAPAWVGLFIPTAYWASILFFGFWVIRRWRNTYFRWRTLSTMAVQTVIGLVLAGPLLVHFLDIDVPLLLRRLHLTWPLHMGVLMPGKKALPTILIYGAVMSLVVWPLTAIFLGKRYCSWFCACGNLAETTGEAFRTRGPKGPSAQKLDVTFYFILVFALAATVAAWLHFLWPDRIYRWLVGFLLVDIVGIGMYPILGSRPWCRFFCPLTAALGFLSQHGRFAIFTDAQRCVECGTCNRYCEMGIDIRRRARQGVPLKDDQCVACGACIAVCPRYALSFRKFPDAAAALQTKNTHAFRKPYKRQLSTPRQRED